MKVMLHFFFTLMLDEGGWLASHPGFLTVMERAPAFLLNRRLDGSWSLDAFELK
jgi:hypothetical protein